MKLLAMIFAVHVNDIKSIPKRGRERSHCTDLAAEDEGEVAVVVVVVVESIKF